jgi:hypothetical protein
VEERQKKPRRSGAEVLSSAGLERHAMKVAENRGFEDSLMREVVGFIQLACALTLGIAGGWAVHQMGVVMGWSGF